MTRPSIDHITTIFDIDKNMIKLQNAQYNLILGMPNLYNQKQQAFPPRRTGLGYELPRLLVPRHCAELCLLGVELILNVHVATASVQVDCAQADAYLEGARPRLVRDEEEYNDWRCEVVLKESLCVEVDDCVVCVHGLVIVSVCKHLREERGRELTNRAV